MKINNSSNRQMEIIFFQEFSLAKFYYFYSVCYLKNQASTHKRTQDIRGYQIVLENIIIRKGGNNNYYFQNYNLPQSITEQLLTHKANQDWIERKHMGNIQCKTLSTLARREERDPTLRIERLVKLERSRLEKNLATLRRKSKKESVETQISQHQKLLDTLNYFMRSGSIITTQERLEKEENQIQQKISSSKQENENLKQSLYSSANKCHNSDQQLKKAQEEENEAKSTIEQLEIQIQLKSEDFEKELQVYQQQIKFNKDKNNKIMKEQEQEIKNHQERVQKAQDSIIRQEERIIKEKNQQNSLLQSQLDQKKQDCQNLQKQMKIDEKNHQNQIEDIKRQLYESSQQIEDKLKSEFNSTLDGWNQEKKAFETQISDLNQKIEKCKQALN